MMKIVTLALQAAAVGGGALGGLWLKTIPASEPVEAAGPGEDTGAENKKPGKSTKGEPGKRAKDAHGSAETTAEGDYGYVKFSRQFIVPVVQTNSVGALVVLDLNLEVSASAAESAYAREPKVRDALLSTLLLLSSEGAFNSNFTRPPNLEAIRASLLSSARAVLGEDVHDILILSVSKQDI